MLMFNNVPLVYLCRQFVDFRKSINSLSAIVEMQLELPATNGAVFVFCNKNRNKLKILYWDKTGFALCYKRLERERFNCVIKVLDEYNGYLQSDGYAAYDQTKTIQLGCWAHARRKFMDAQSRTAKR